MKRVVLTVVTLLIAGCSLQPVYERPAAPVSATFPAGDAYKSPTGSGTLPAVDIGQSAEFYQKVFGWRVRRRGCGTTSGWRSRR